MPEQKDDVRLASEPDYFEGVDLEEDLDESDFNWLCVQGTLQSFNQNIHLYHQGDVGETVYVLRSGSVKATCTDRFGHEALLKIHGPGSFLGLSALRPTGRRDATGVTLEPCEVVMFRRDEFFTLMRNEGRLGILLVQLLLKRQQQLHARVSEMTGHRVDQRLARVLLQLSAEANLRGFDDEQIPITITHEELSNLVLSRRQYVTAILRSFVTMGIIENSRRSVLIADFERLYQIAAGGQSSVG